MKLTGEEEWTEEVRAYSVTVTLTVYAGTVEEAEDIVEEVLKVAPETVRDQIRIREITIN